jgi:hypothetical protein
VCLDLGKKTYDPEEIITIGKNLPTEKQILNLRDRIASFPGGEGIRKRARFQQGFVDKFIDEAIRNGLKAR